MLTAGPHAAGRKPLKTESCNVPMTWLGPWILPITGIVALIGGCVVMWVAWRVQEATDPAAPRVRSGNILEFECSECQQMLVIPPDAYTKLSGAEVALVVGGKPRLAGRKLGEYVCPHCEASHYFTIDRTPPVWVGANLYAPQTKSNNCLECRKRVRPPQWTANPEQDNVLGDEDLRPDYGLVCSRCGALCCVACVAQFSRQDVRTAGARCPRCGRGPIEQLYRP